jgi:hypothetical protein
MLALIFRIIYRILSLVLSAAIVYLIISAVQVETASHSTRSASHVERAAAIVVTGTPGTPNMSTDYLVKLRLAKSLYSAHNAPLLFVGLPSGVNRKGVMNGQWNREFSSTLKPADVTAILAANVGREFSRVVQRIGRGHRVIVVTDAINALYVEGVATDDGLHPEVVAPSASRKLLFSQISQLFREASGVAVGRVIGFDNATWASK